MKLRLCVLVPAHWEALMGGSEYQAKVLVEFLLANHDVELVYLTAYDKPGFTPEGYRIVRFSDRRGLRRYGSFFDALRLYRALRRLKPDAILQFVGCAHTGIAAFYARRNRCRMIWRVTHDRHLLPERAPWWHVHRHLERLFLNYGIRNAHAILAQTANQRRLLIDGFGRDDAIVVANFHPDPPPALARQARGEQRVVWVGNLNRTKNPAAFVRLAAKFAALPDVTFTMAGAGNDDPWTAEQLALIRSAPNVEYLGPLTQDQVNALLERATVLVNTSEHEGFANTFIQAWLRQVPVASLHVDPDGLLSRAGLGSVAGSEEQLARDVARWLETPLAERAALGARCREYAAANHSTSNIATIARLLGAAALAGARGRIAA
ncbi:MAG TPA: glycosyltransferase family 4 protein [Gammaproteobacteria bacterium]|nr:glycosyltransferase family 4 protein [Gammaproteobacteria bacterium]